MEAFVEHRFENGFLLDEERIRKINEIIVTRLKQANVEANPQFKVYRGDTFTYTTDKIEDVLAEDNSDWQRIKQITVLVTDDDSVPNGLLLDLDFGTRGTYLHIEGRNRDAVFLLFSELRQYIATEVNVLKGRLERFFLYLPMIIVFSVMAILMIILASDFIGVRSRSYSVTRQEALETSSIELKLNYLIEQQYEFGRLFLIDNRMNQVFIAFFVAMAVAMILIVGRKWVARLIRHFYPDHMFLLGKEIEKHRKREAQREKIVWGVIISFVISFVAGAILWLVTK